MPRTIRSAPGILARRYVGPRHPLLVLWLPGRAHKREPNAGFCREASGSSTCNAVVVALIGCVRQDNGMADDRSDWTCGHVCAEVSAVRISWRSWSTLKGLNRTVAKPSRRARMIEWFGS